MLTLIGILLGILLVLCGIIILAIGFGPIILVCGFIFNLLFNPVFAILVILVFIIVRLANRK